MARKYLTTAVRLIPNFNMTKPWSAPLTADEETGLASSALLAQASDTNRAITAILAQFSGQYVENLGNANSQTPT